MIVKTHYLSVGDKLTPLGAQLKRKNTAGVYAAIDLVGLTVKFTLVAEDGTVVVAETDTGVSVVTAASGLVQYDFQAALAVGTYYGWFTVYNGVEFDTYPVEGRKLRIIVSGRV